MPTPSRAASCQIGVDFPRGRNAVFTVIIIELRETGNISRFKKRAGLQKRKYSLRSMQKKTPYSGLRNDWWKDLLNFVPILTHFAFCDSNFYFLAFYVCRIIVEPV